MFAINQESKAMLLYTHRSENHMQRNGNVEIESPVIDDAGYKKHGHQNKIVFLGHMWG